MHGFFTFCMFYLSFTPLWISALFVDCKSIFIDKSENIITEIAFILAVLIFWIISFIVLCLNIHDESCGNTEKFELVEAKENKTITSDFFLSYILPLFAFDFAQWDGVVEFLIFFIVLSFLCIRHNHLSVNIILELMGFKMFECKLKSQDDVTIERVVLSKESLTTHRGEKIKVKRINNEYVQKIG